MKNALICFTRVPRPGLTKTRLLPILTPEQCAGLHWAFLRDLAQVYRVVDAHLFVAYTADENWEALKPVFPTARDFFPQEGEDLPDHERRNPDLEPDLRRHRPGAGAGV